MAILAWPGRRARVAKGGREESAGGRKEKFYTAGRRDRVGGRERRSGKGQRRRDGAIEETPERAGRDAGGNGEACCGTETDPGMIQLGGAG